MYLGIDLGTSAVKTVLMDETQNIKAQASCTLPITQRQPLWSEQNPEDWWQATCDTIKTLQADHATLLTQVKAIGLSGQMHGATLLDKHNKVLRPAILWNDGRSAKQCQILAARVPHYQTITGNLIMPGFTAPKLLWVAEHEPEVFSRVAKVLLPKDYLRLQMTGVYATDQSDAAGTMWLDVGQRRWSEQMLQATGLTPAQMPELFEGCDVTAKVTPELAAKWGISPEALVAGGAGDNAAAAISMNVIAPGSAFLSLGTSGVYFVASKDYRTNPAAGVHTFCHCLPNLWHQMTVHLSAASCLSWLASVVGTSPAELLADAQNTPQSHDNIIFLPYLSGERTPHNDPYARGVFFGLSHTTERADMTRAVLEGVAFAFADGQDAMLAAKLPIQEVAVVGGGARSIYWGQILASVLNRPLVYREDREAGAALGAARLGWLAAHPEVSPETAFTTPPIENTVAPVPSLLETYAKKRALFQQIYEQLRGVFAEAL